MMADFIGADPASMDGHQKNDDDANNIHNTQKKIKSDERVEQTYPSSPFPGVSR